MAAVDKHQRARLRPFDAQVAPGVGGEVAWAGLAANQQRRVGVLQQAVAVEIHQLWLVALQQRHHLATIGFALHRGGQFVEPRKVGRQLREIGVHGHVDQRRAGVVDRQRQLGAVGRGRWHADVVAKTPEATRANDVQVVAAGALAHEAGLGAERAAILLHLCQAAQKARAHAPNILRVDQIVVDQRNWHNVVGRDFTGHLHDAGLPHKFAQFLRAIGAAPNLCVERLVQAGAAPNQLFQILEQAVAQRFGWLRRRVAIRILLGPLVFASPGHQPQPAPRRVDQTHDLALAQGSAALVALLPVIAENAEALVAATVAVHHNAERVRLDLIEMARCQLRAEVVIKHGALLQAGFGQRRAGANLHRHQPRLHQHGAAVHIHAQVVAAAHARLCGDAEQKSLAEQRVGRVGVGGQRRRFEHAGRTVGRHAQHAAAFGQHKSLAKNHNAQINRLVGRKIGNECWHRLDRALLDFADMEAEPVGSAHAQRLVFVEHLARRGFGGEVGVDVAVGAWLEGVQGWRRGRAAQVARARLVLA